MTIIPNTRITRLLVLASLVVLSSPGDLQSGWDVRKMLTEGMRIKVEGKQRGERLFEADEIELKGDTSEKYSLEGIIRKLDLQEGFIDIAGFSVAVTPGTPVCAADADTLSASSIDIGMRVNIELTINGSRLMASTITELDSRDQDVEIKAPIEHLVIHGKNRMEIILLNRRFLCDENTQFYDPDKNRVSVDYFELDIYNRLVDNDDERPASLLAISDLVVVGGEFQVDLIPERNYDLDEAMGEDIVFSKVSTILELSSRPTSEFDLFFKMAAQEPMSEFDPFHPNRSEGNIRLAEAYVLWRDVFTRRLGLKIGRQDFDEKREWLYDENLDAVRFFLNLDPLLVEMSASTNFSENTESDKGVVNYILYGAYEMNHRRTFAAYVIHREDDDPFINFNRRWYGLRSFGDVGKSLEYWMELSLLRGERRGRKLSSGAIDIGFTARLRKLAFAPSLTMGYAYGTGDDNLGDMVDGNFRQTGFDDDNDKFNGVSSFKYFGEVLDPELSNLRVVTFGIGSRWSENGSVDVIYHVYRQDRPENKLHGSDLLIEPNGNSKAIGDEIDLVLGYEKLWNIDLKLIVGFFRPGPAFSPFTDTASRTRFQIEYNF